MSFRVLLATLILICSGCKKNPITTTISPGRETIMVICSPASAGPGSVITIAVAIAGNSKEIRVFGLDVDYDGQMFEFESAGKGSLSATWATVDGNAIVSGSIKVGGYVGEGSHIPINSNGTLGLVKLKVTGAPYGNGQQSQVWIKQYTDDIAGFTPESASAVFTLKK
jgi:hypothetical protein